MKTVKTWRRLALSSYVLAGTVATITAYTASTASANTQALAQAIQQIDAKKEAARERQADRLNMFIAQDYHRGVNADKRPAAVVDWPSVSAEAMPSMVAVAVLERPKAEAQYNRAWSLPGSLSNAATDQMTRIRAWQKGWHQEDTARNFRISCAAVSIGDNRLLTAAHCVDGVEAIQVHNAMGEKQKAHVEGADLAADVALLKHEGEPLPAIKMMMHFPRQGQPVMAIGSPGGAGFAVSTGTVSKYGWDSIDNPTVKFMMAAVPTIGGSSGGVLLNAHGEMVGLVSQGQGPFTLAVPAGFAMAKASAF